MRQPEEVQEDQARAAAGEVLWNQVHGKVMKCWAEVEKKSQEMIQEVRINEANPWLERARWSKYLKELNRPELLASIREPVDGDPDAEASIREPSHNPGTEEEEEKEPVESVIWEVMGDVVEISQASTIDRISVFVRMEVIRTEQH